MKLGVVTFGIILSAVIRLSMTGGAFASENPSATAFDARVARLSAPADPELVQQLVEDPLIRSDARAARRLIEALSCGGFGAVDGLVTLCKHRDATVCADALRRLASLGLRSTHATQCARAAIRSNDPRIRDAAYAALGRVGRREDVHALLDALASDDAELKESGYHALRLLTGLSMPPLSQHWEYWWTQTSRDLPARIESALSTLDANADVASVAAARRLLASSAWFDVERISESARAWLHSANAPRRLEGYRLASAARLADLADELQSAFKYEFNAEIWLESRDATIALGGRTRGVLPPQGVDLPVEDGSPFTADRRLEALAAAERAADRSKDDGAVPSSDAKPADARPATLLMPDVSSASRRVPRARTPARLAVAIELLRSRRFPEARDALEKACAAAPDSAELGVARQGFTALSWLERAHAMERDSRGPAIRSQARRALAGTIWVDLF